MTRYYRPTEPGDIARIEPQTAQAEEWRAVVEHSRGRWDAMLGRAMFVTVLRGNLILAIAGLVPVWEGRAAATFMMSKHVNRADLLYITRGVQRYLERIKADKCYRRIEATVKHDFEPGRCWAKLFGFEFEGTMRRYSVVGETHMLFALVR